MLKTEIGEERIKSKKREYRIRIKKNIKQYIKGVDNRGKKRKTLNRKKREFFVQRKREKEKDKRD